MPKQDMRLFNALKSNGPVKRTVNGWKATCPCHDDNRPSLDITIGDEGGIVCHCKACNADGYDVADALDLPNDALFYGTLPKGISRKKEGATTQASTKIKRIYGQAIKGKRSRQMQKLFESLKLPPNSVIAFGFRYCSEQKAYMIPETDATGQIIGLQYRLIDGKKWSEKGGKRGVVGIDQLEGSDTLFICEGATDSIAVYAEGFRDVIGRPSATLGDGLIKEVIRSRNYRSVVIFADPTPQEQKGAAKL